MRNSVVQVDFLVKYVKLFEQGDSTADERKQILIKEHNRIAEQIAEMQSTLDRLDKKIELYEKDIIPAEKELIIDKNNVY